MVRLPDRQRKCMTCGQPATMILKARLKEQRSVGRASTVGDRSWPTCAEHLAKATEARTDECPLRRYTWTAVDV